MKKILPDLKTIKKFTLLLSLLLTISLSGCSVADSFPYTADPSIPYSASAFMLDTFVTIEAYPTDRTVDYNEKLQGCLSLCRKYENLFSRTVDSSDISKINSAGGRPVTVSSDTIDIVKKGLYYSEISGGVYDITIGSVSSLWDFHAKYPHIPDDKALMEAVSHVNYRNVIIDEKNNTITMLDPNCRLDLGSIAKGYIADRLKDYLVSEGVTSAVINLGGNVLTVGEKPCGGILERGKYIPFKIGIQKPFSKNEVYETIELSDNSLVSSGTYERYFTENGKLYHHILDPKSGYPVESGLNGVSIVSESSVDGDALSTICFALGSKKAEEFLSSPAFEDVQMIAIPSE